MLKRLALKPPLFVFLPWLSYMGQPGTALKLADQSHIRVAIAKDCAKPQKTFAVEVVSSPSTRAHGLSERTSPLSDNEGMLFVMDQPEPVDFWMKNTFIPLEIGYFDASGKLVRKYEMTVEKDPANPIKHYHSREKVKLALEVAPGALKQATSGTTLLCVEK